MDLIDSLTSETLPEWKCEVRMKDNDTLVFRRAIKVSIERTHTYTEGTASILVDPERFYDRNPQSYDILRDTGAEDVIDVCRYSERREKRKALDSDISHSTGISRFIRVERETDDSD